MRNEQNIDDILMQLKAAMDGGETPEVSLAEQDEVGELSEETLKQRLRMQYATEGAENVQQTEGEYALDHELLREFEAEPSLEIAVTEPEESNEIFDEDIEEFDEALEEEIEEEIEDSGADSKLEDAQLDELMNDILTEDGTEDVTDEDPFEEMSDEIVSDLIMTAEKESATEEPVADESEEYEQFPEIETVPMNDLLRDYETPESVSDLEDPSVIPEEIEEEPTTVTAESRVNESVFDLMLQLGCEDELEEASGEELDEDFLEEDTTADDGEYRSADQNEEIRAAYRRRTRFSIGQILVLSVLTAVLFLYDTLPLLEVEFIGLINYRAYPGAYILIGMQWMLIAAVCLWQPLLNGMKKLVSTRPDLYSMIGLVTIFTLAYDLTMVILDERRLPPMFHFLVVLLMLLTALAEYALLAREKKIFSIFSSENSKYTLERDGGEHSVAEKMYRGGLDEETRVFTHKSVTFPNGFFRSIGSEDRLSSRWLAWILFPGVVLSVVIGVVVMFVNESLQEALVSSMTVLLALLPLSSVAAVCLPLYLSSFRLSRRGIALTGKGIIEEQVEVDMMVFNDLHLFRRCEPKNTGIVIYEKGQSATLFGCLHALYSRIGGPMAKIFENVPEGCRFERIYVRRVTRSGIEAVVDRRHLLIVGDAGFMQRYGFFFPMNEEWDGRATLCVSLDGKMSAKISAEYRIEPIFEMLVERLASNGVQCVIETYDPMIHSAFVSEKRQIGRSPISVVHKNASDLRAGEKRRSRKAETAVLVLSSRLKLIEAVVWCKRLVKIDRRCDIVTAVYGLFGLVLVALCIGFDLTGELNQYWLLLFMSVSCLSVLTLILRGFPSRTYFTLDALKTELAAEAEKKAKQPKKNKTNLKRQKKKGKKKRS